MNRSEMTDDDFRYFGFRLAVRLTDGTLAVRRNPLTEENQRWAEFEAYLDGLDDGTATARERRLDAATFHALVDDLRRARGAWDGPASAAEDPPAWVVAWLRDAPRPTDKGQTSGIGKYVGYHHRVAARTPAGALVVRRNPLPPEHPWWRRLEDYLDELDGGTPAARARRLDTAAFQARVDALRIEHGERDFIPATAEEPPGEARIVHRLPAHGTDEVALLCLTFRATDRWPGTAGSLGQIGFWVGTAAAHRYLGPDLAATHDVMRSWVDAYVNERPWTSSEAR